MAYPRLIKRLAITHYNLGEHIAASLVSIRKLHQLSHASSAYGSNVSLTAASTSDLSAQMRVGTHE
eukprot:3299084-Pleurochrysis_carterae.AAC.3